MEDQTYLDLKQISLLKLLKILGYKIIGTHIEFLGFPVGMIKFVNDFPSLQYDLKEPEPMLSLEMYIEWHKWFQDKNFKHYLYDDYGKWSHLPKTDDLVQENIIKDFEYDIKNIDGLSAKYYREINTSA